MLLIKLNNAATCMIGIGLRVLSGLGQCGLKAENPYFSSSNMSCDYLSPVNKFYILDYLLKFIRV